jgi:hypothetical protein
MGRQSADQHGRSGDESAASGYGIHKAGEEEEQAENEKYAQRNFHGEVLL